MYIYHKSYCQPFDGNIAQTKVGDRAGWPATKHVHRPLKISTIGWQLARADSLYLSTNSPILKSSNAAQCWIIQTFKSRHLQV